jgi:heterodisulfide reductase subunit B
VRIGYYPGCALHGSSNDYEQSVRACLDCFGTELAELQEWICCGATAAHSLNARLAVALPARNLGLARQQGCQELFAPCPMCSMQLLKANTELRCPQTRQAMSEIVELEVDDSVRVLNLIEVLQRTGAEEIKKRVVAPLQDCQPACYYGCLLTRPPDVVRFDDPEQPSSMETLLEICGAKPVSWNFRTECCGAGMTLSNEATVLELSHRILTDAREHGANCLVVACPMCHVNLDMKQSAIERHYDTQHNLPVYYLTDLIGRAMGLSDEQLGVDRHFVAVG